MLKKKLGIECIELDWNERFDLIYDYYKIPSTLIIPEGCVRVGLSAFEDWSWRRLDKVIIPESVEVIGREAFCYCSRATIILKKAESEFKEIGEWAFRECKDVKEEIRN